MRIEVINIDDPGIITLSTTAPRVGSMLKAGIFDQDGAPMLTKAQWSRAANADAPFIDIDGANHHAPHRLNPTTPPRQRTKANI